MAYDVVQFDITRSGSEEIELVSREGPPFKLTLLLPLGCSDESTIEFEERFALHPRASQPAEDPSPGEDRLITLEASETGRLLVVVHTERGNIIRLISARRATKQERFDYEEGV